MIQIHKYNPEMRRKVCIMQVSIVALFTVTKKRSRSQVFIHRLHKVHNACLTQKYHHLQRGMAS